MKIGFFLLEEGPFLVVGETVRQVSWIWHALGRAMRQLGGGTSYCYTLYRTGQAPPAVHMAPGGSHRLAFNPFHFGEILGPGEKGAMKTTSVVPMALEAPHMGELHNIALGGPTAILDECQPRLGHGGLAWWGLRFLLCSRASWRLGYFV